MYHFVHVSRFFSNVHQISNVSLPVQHEKDVSTAPRDIPCSAHETPFWYRKKFLKNPFVICTSKVGLLANYLLQATSRVPLSILDFKSDDICPQIHTLNFADVKFDVNLSKDVSFNHCECVIALTDVVLMLRRLQSRIVIVSL